MRVLVVGGGGREHALVWKIAQSPLVKQVFAWPGNPGMAPLAELVDEPGDISSMARWAEERRIDLTVVGPEDPLVEGLADEFRARGLPVFGPDRRAARLEGSKAFAKDVAREAGIPIPWYRVFEDPDEAMEFIREVDQPVAVKADGLAAGKGVIVADERQEALEAVEGLMVRGELGKAGRKVVIEEKLDGEEVSFLVITDGERVVPLVSSQDHKPIYEGDRGPNTGGMGAYSPAPLATPELTSVIMDRVIHPAVRQMRELGCPYRGVLYAGLMVTEQGPRLLEFNCRFGDPETQVILPRMDSDLVPLLIEAADGLLEASIDWKEDRALGVVLATEGYPTAARTGDVIQGLEDVERDPEILVFHAGTDRREGEWITTGGRVLCLTALGKSLGEAHGRAYRAAARVTFPGIQYRRDIGYRALNQ